MKRLTICFVFFVTFVGITYGQPKTRKNVTASCLSVTEAKGLLLGLKHFREPESFLFPSGTARFSNHDLSTVKRNYPILYLFYQSGHVNLEYNGIHTFSTPTEKGEQLDSEYNGSIPLSLQTLVSVAKPICTKNRARLQVVISRKPTQVAVDLLGSNIYKTKPFNRNANTILESRRVNGKWKIDELNLIFLD